MTDEPDIEVTPEMAMAAYDVLLPYCEDVAVIMDVAADVYRAMERARLSKPSKGGE